MLLQMLLLGWKHDVLLVKDRHLRIRHGQQSCWWRWHDLLNSVQGSAITKVLCIVQISDRVKNLLAREADKLVVL